jgi:hypothetical protein
MEIWHLKKKDLKKNSKSFWFFLQKKKFIESATKKNQKNFITVPKKKKG